MKLHEVSEWENAEVPNGQEREMLLKRRQSLSHRFDVLGDKLLLLHRNNVKSMAVSNNFMVPPKVASSLKKTEWKQFNIFKRPDERGPDYWSLYVLSERQDLVDKVSRLTSQINHIVTQWEKIEKELE